MENNFAAYRKKSIFNRADYLTKLDTDPSQDEFAVSDLSASFGSDTNSYSAAQRALIFDDFEEKPNKSGNLSARLCGTTTRKLFILWIIVLLMVLILLVIGLTGKYYVADEVCFVLMTFISKYRVIINPCSVWCRNNDASGPVCQLR
jgi:hypothetical protein